jgi:CheY-like chemotaxis protein
MAMKIVILEDNPDRREAMARYLADRLYSFDAAYFESPQPMLAYLREHLGEAICISLDHDMELVDDGAGRLVDPGSGREVADFLAGHPPQCPVILHTTNTAAADGMASALTHTGWKVYRVAPWGDLEWVHVEWGRTVRRAIVEAARPARDGPANGAGHVSARDEAPQPEVSAE